MSNARYVTVTVLHNLPLHNLNRDQNGAPKTCVDGGVQRARLSSQSIKRAARVALRADGTGESIRTRLAPDLVLERALEVAAQRGVELDEKAAKAKAKKVIGELAKSKDTDDKSAAKDDADDKGGDNMLLFGQDEISSLAVAIVEEQAGGKAAGLDDFVKDCRSSVLDIAAFGRMFAAQAGLGTHAAVSVSPAVTTHAATVTLDYFSAVEEAPQAHAGAGHIGMAYYTSGTYHRSFTINVDQLRRSWSALGLEGSREQVAALTKALATALPSGKDTNSAARTLPFVVLAEATRTRVSYGFENPVTAAEGGGYGQPSLDALAAQRRQALDFDPELFVDAVAYVAPGFDADLSASQVDGIAEVAAFVVDHVHQGL